MTVKISKSLTTNINKKLYTYKFLSTNFHKNERDIK